MASASAPMPEGYATGCAVAALALLLTLLLHHRASRVLRAGTSFSAKRLLYSIISSLASGIAMVNFLAVTAPELHKGAALAQHTLVAGVMACFMELLLLMLYRTSLAKGDDQEAQVPGIANVLEHFESSFSRLSSQFQPSPYIDGAMRVLKQQPEIAYWASPPIGCCFALCPWLPCGKPQPASARLLALLRRAVIAYAAGAVLAPLLELWVDGVPVMAAHREGIQRLVRAAEYTVTVLALYSLFITYRLSKGPLHAYHTTLKFAAVKILVFVAPLQRALLVHFYGPLDGPWWGHVLTVLETPLLSLLLSHAFPASELPGAPLSEMRPSVSGGHATSDDEASELLHAR